MTIKNLDHFPCFSSLRFDTLLAESMALADEEADETSLKIGKKPFPFAKRRRYDLEMKEKHSGSNEFHIREHTKLQKQCF